MQDSEPRPPSERSDAPGGWQAAVPSRAESAGVVERVLHHLCHDLAHGHNVKVSGFGTFILRDKGQRIGRNPKTGIEVPIAPRRVMTFRASQIMRDRIAKG